MTNECDFTHVNDIHGVVLFCCLLIRLHIMTCVLLLVQKQIQSDKQLRRSSALFALL